VNQSNACCAVWEHASLVGNIGSNPVKMEIELVHECTAVIQLFYILGYYLLLNDELLMQKRLIVKV